MTGRHTRQGCARGQAHGTLDREDVDLGGPGRWAATSHSAMAERDALRRPAARVEPLAPAEGLPFLCWCGAEVGHPWPGKAGGAPHPR